MTASTSSAEGQSRPSPEADTPEPAGLLVGGDRCANCGTTMAVDQRYCVECGTRRGKPRFALAAAPVAALAQPAPATRSAGGWNRLSALLAVIAVLLALGIGVLIGNSTQASFKQPVKVQVTGGTLSPGSGSGATTTPKSGGSGGSSPRSCSKGTAGCKNGKQTGNFFGG